MLEATAAGARAFAAELVKTLDEVGFARAEVREKAGGEDDGYHNNG